MSKKKKIAVIHTSKCTCADCSKPECAKQESIPVIEFDYNTHRELAVNIWHAQKAGKPAILTHGADSSVNRYYAIKGIPRILSRDEYPFASSCEGGGSSWVGHVPAAQQNSQGAIIKNFLQKYKILPCNKYRVRVINHPDEH